MTANEFCQRIQSADGKYRSRVLVVPSHADFAAICGNYGEGFEIVATSEFVHSNRYVPMPERVFEGLEDRRKALKARKKQMIVVGLDGYLQLLDPKEVQRAFNLINGYLSGTGLETVVFVFRKAWHEMRETFVHPSIFGNCLCCTIGEAQSTDVPRGNHIFVSRMFSSRILGAYPDLRTYLRRHESQEAIPEGDVCIAVDFNGNHAFPGISKHVRQYYDLKELFSEYCGFSADLSDDAFRWIAKNTVGTDIQQELKRHFFPTGVADVREFALKRNEALLGMDEKEVFQQLLRTVAPSGSFLSDVLKRTEKHPDQFLPFYANVTDEVLDSSEAVLFAEERNAAIKNLGIGLMEVRTAVDMLISRTMEYSAAKMTPWLKLGLESEESEWIRRAVAGRNDEREVAARQSGLLCAYLSDGGFDEDEMLRQYFARYRELKCADAVDDEFSRMAFEAVVPYGIAHRASMLSAYKNDKETAILVVDALGAEYLPFILARCKVHRFRTIKVEVARVDMPTSTPYNQVKQEWSGEERYRKYDGFDKLLHGTFESHAEAIAAQLRELDIRVMGQVEKLLAVYRRVILTADHGATRLAAIARRDGTAKDIREFDGKIEVLDWRYAERRNGIYLNSPLAAEPVGGAYAIIKGYNRFPKQGAPGFEMHGGATLEEQLVPFVAIERAIIPENAPDDSSTQNAFDLTSEQITENDDFDI